MRSVLLDSEVQSLCSHLPRKNASDSDRLVSIMLGPTLPTMRPICSGRFSPSRRSDLCSMRLHSLHGVFYISGPHNLKTNSPTMLNIIPPHVPGNSAPKWRCCPLLQPAPGMEQPLWWSRLQERPDSCKSLARPQLTSRRSKHQPSPVWTWNQSARDIMEKSHSCPEIIFLRKVSASRWDLACTSTQICSAMGRVHNEAWQMSSNTSLWDNISSLAESLTSRLCQPHLLGYTCQNEVMCLKLYFN